MFIYFLFCENSCGGGGSGGIANVSGNGRGEVGSLSEISVDLV